jgi:hypothetical protein
MIQAHENGQGWHNMRRTIIAVVSLMLLAAVFVAQELFRVDRIVNEKYKAIGMDVSWVFSGVYCRSEPGLGKAIHWYNANLCGLRYAVIFKPNGETIGDIYSVYLIRPYIQDVVRFH